MNWFDALDNDAIFPGSDNPHNVRLQMDKLAENYDLCAVVDAQLTCIERLVNLPVDTYDTMREDVIRAVNDCFLSIASAQRQLRKEIS